MEILYSILAGIIQGLTEFLPVSSSGHLVLFHNLSNFDFFDQLFFDVIVHLGTLLSLIFFFWKEIWRYVFAFLSSFLKFDRNNIDQKMAWYLFFATLPAAFAGYFFEDMIEMTFRNPVIVAFMLIFFGIVLYFVDLYSVKVLDFSQIKLKNSLIIGLAQIIALVPGVSRSGITIIAGLSQKLKRESAAKFSFLLSAPIIFGAGMKKIFDLASGNIGDFSYLVLIFGFFSSMISGYLCIKYFLKFLQSHSLKIFAYYRVILGIVILLFLLFK